MKQFIKDLGISAKIKFLGVADCNRHHYTIKHKGKKIDVFMPALPIHEVRYMNFAGQRISYYHRLYIDGASWVWFYALKNFGK